MGKSYNSLTHIKYLRHTHGYTLNQIKLTPELIACVFKLPFTDVITSTIELASDAAMKKMFGNPTSNGGYFYPKNLLPAKRNRVKWYMEQLCLLNKFDYMSKDAFAPLLAAEKGKDVSWAHVLFDRLMVEIEGKVRGRLEEKQDCTFLVGVV